MSIGSDYGDEYSDYVENWNSCRIEKADLMSFEEWLQDKAEQATWRAEELAEDRGTERE